MSNALAPKPPSTEIRWPRPGTALVVLAGEHDLSSAPDLQQRLDALGTSCSHLIVDLSAVEFIDSITIATFVRAKRIADENGRRFNVVLGGTSIVQRAIEVAAVGPNLNVVPSVEHALAPAEDVEAAAS
jgi:anti-anti-sigma factor